MFLNEQIFGEKVAALLSTSEMEESRKLGFPRKKMRKWIFMIRIPFLAPLRGKLLRLRLMEKILREVFSRDEPFFLKGNVFSGDNIKKREFIFSLIKWNWYWLISRNILVTFIDLEDFKLSLVREVFEIATLRSFGLKNFSRGR